VRFAVGIPNVREYADPRLLVSLARRAEAAGWDGCFVWDHLAYRPHGAPVTDPWVAVAAIAQATERIKLGIMVVQLARRRPWKVAREVVSLDVLSDGRLIMGTGLGSLPEDEFEAFGEPGDARIRAERVDEGLEIVAGLTSGRAFEFQGKHYTVRESVFLPAPVQERIPIWVAGRWPNRPPFRRAARWDGVFPTFEGLGHDELPLPSQLREAIQYTWSHREGEGRFDVVMEGVTPGEDPGKGAEVVAAFAEVGLTWWVEKLGWFRGPAAEMERRIDQGPSQ
jgi:alkanesulfonate monooxygenase SsuD/methylene tetrahydromethanopterin reductase-like flavin-dependent oxidoreductase (luciferase family)